MDVAGPGIPPNCFFFLAAVFKTAGSSTTFVGSGFGSALAAWIAVWMDASFAAMTALSFISSISFVVLRFFTDTFAFFLAGAFTFLLLAGAFAFLLLAGAFAFLILAGAFAFLILAGAFALLLAGSFGACFFTFPPFP